MSVVHEQTSALDVRSDVTIQQIMFILDVLLNTLICRLCQHPLTTHPARFCVLSRPPELYQYRLLCCSPLPWRTLHQCASSPWPMWSHHESEHWEDAVQRHSVWLWLWDHRSFHPTRCPKSWVSGEFFNYCQCSIMNTKCLNLEL